jgi:hypothetical protein
MSDLAREESGSLFILENAFATAHRGIIVALAVPPAGDLSFSPLCRPRRADVLPV